MATAALPTAAAEWRRHWPLVVATSAGMALAAMLSVCFGIVLEPMEQELGWSRAQISSGQRAAPGAIERVEIDPVTKEPRFRVIGCDIWSDSPDFAAAKLAYKIMNHALAR